MDLGLLERTATERKRAREMLRLSVREQLASALAEVFPRGTEIFVFGSLCRRNGFSAASDVDIAVTDLPEGMDRFDLAATLSTRLRREVDIVLLNKTRLRETILRTAQKWIV